MVVGREEHLSQLSALLAGARSGRAGILRLVGDPGLGKTTLLDAAAQEAADTGMHVIRLTALEAEQGIPGAGLDILLRHLGMPEAALTPAGLLAALGAAAQDSPLLLTLDDVQWMDDQTLAAVSFATRRLLADPIAVVLAGRPVTDRIPALAAIPRLEVPALTVEQGVQMLGTVVPTMPAATAAQVTRAFSGVPLALVDVGALLPSDVLAGTAPLPSPLPVSAAVQDRYATGFAALGSDARQAIVLLAADNSAQPDVIGAALKRSGLAVEDLLPAVDAGLVRMIPTPVFAHPLARAAVQSAAHPAEVRQANAVLAELLTERGEHSAALRHRVASTTPPDLDLASALEEFATALSRTPASRSDASDVALVAAQFAPERSDRVRFRLLAADLSGSERALSIVGDIEGLDLSADERARALLVRLSHDDASIGQGAFRRSSAASAEGLALLDTLEDLDLTAQTRAACDNWRAWLAMETLDRPALQGAVARLEATPIEDDDWEVLLALGQALTFLVEHGRAVPVLRRAVAASGAVDPETLSPDRVISWAVAPGWLLDVDAEHAARFARMAAILRATGQPENVVSAAFFSSERARREGAWSRAEALLREALDVSALVGEPDMTASLRLACLLAYRGQEADVHELCAVADSPGRSWSAWNSRWATQAQGALALTLGRPEQAVEILAPVRDLPFAGRGARDHFAASLVDLTEGLVATGRTGEAAAVAEDLAQRLQGVVDPFGPAMVARCRALVAQDDADVLFEQALSDLARTTEVFETARTNLLFGEHLRRTRRPRESRAPLTLALQTFEGVGAPHWAQRARRELSASGHRVAPRTERTDVALTPQESRVAMAVAEGLTNAEVAQQLFLSVKTVEFHLGRVFRKLGVRSRGGLARALAARGM